MMLDTIRVADPTRDLRNYADALLARLEADLGNIGTSAAGNPTQEEITRLVPRVIVPDDPVLIALIERGAQLLNGGQPEAADASPSRLPEPLRVPLGPFEADGVSEAPPAIDLPILVPAVAAETEAPPPLTSPQSTLPQSMLPQSPASQSPPPPLSSLASALPALAPGFPGQPSALPTPPTVPPGAIAPLVNPQAAALAGMQGALAAMAASNANRLRPDAALYRAVRVGARGGSPAEFAPAGLRQIWPSADGYVAWAFADDPPRMRAMVARLTEDGAAGMLAEVDWDAVRIADIPHETVLSWEALVGSWLLARRGAVLAELSRIHDLGLSVITGIDEPV